MRTPPQIEIITTARSCSELAIVTQDPTKVYVWNRDGEKRMIPRHVLANARDIRDDHVKLFEAGVVVERREQIHVRWDQCLPLDKPMPVKVNHAAH